MKNMTLLGLGLALAVPAWAQEKRDCPECKSGERAYYAEHIVGSGDYVYTPDPSCGGNMSSQAQAAFQALANSQVPGISLYAGPLVDQAGQQVVDFIKANIQGTIGELLSPWTNPAANCQIIGVIIPRDAQYTGYRLEARDYKDSGRCTAGQDCIEGWCKFEAEPLVERTGMTQVVWTVFKNWSHDRERAAKLTVYFRPPAGWVEPR